MNIKQSNNDNHKDCCFCRRFSLEGYRWGYCKVLGVYMNGKQDACKLFIPPFAVESSEIHHNTEKTNS